MRFDLYYNRILEERPYYFTDEGADGFDLELEKYKYDYKGLKNRIKEILNGVMVFDSRGNQLHLHEDQQKQDFIRFLEDDVEIMMFMQFRFKKPVSDLYTDKISESEDDYEYIEGIGYVAYIDGKRVVYDRDELPELKERLAKEKEKFTNIQTPEIMDMDEDKLSLKQYIARNIHKFPELAYIFDKDKKTI
jgi:hypothetical protein